MRDIDAATAIATLRAGEPLERVRVPSALDLRALLPPVRWWRRRDETITVPIVIRDSVLHGLDAMFLVFKSPIVLEDVVVLGSFALHSAFFHGGLCASRCRFDGPTDICWAGHNAPDAPFVLESCRFERFVNFDDEWFKGPVIIRDCTFANGTNLLGTRGWPNQVTFDVPAIIERNTGQLDLDDHRLTRDA